MKFIQLTHFLTLTDTEEISHCSSYDHNLVFASLVRQVLSFLFSFSVFIYGSMMFLPFAQALIVSLLIAATLFTIDQAIIGSEWALQFNFFRRSWINYSANILFLPIRLLPRILFSIAIAYFIATIAEISIQHKAIDEVLQKEMRVLNKEYFKRLNDKEVSIDQSLMIQEQHLNELNDKINDKRTLLASFNSDMSSKDEDSIVERVKLTALNLANNQGVLDFNTNQINELNAKLVEQENLLQHWKSEKAQELLPERGAKKGVRWRNANKKTIAIGLIIGQLKAQLVRLDAFHAMYTEQVNKSLQENNKIRSLKSSMGGDSLKALELKKEVERENFIRNKHLMQQELETFRQSLKDEGIFFEIKNGPLGRYIALNKLYDDPDYGLAAQEFSYGLKGVIILIELSPVIVMVFFSPYSFYAEKMRAKKHAIENAIPTHKLKSEIEESKKQYSILREEKNDQRNRKFTESLDENFNTAFNNEYFKRGVPS